MLEVRIAPFGFRRWSIHYLLCRKQFAPPDHGLSPVPYFLNCRAIELGLKAHLLESQELKSVKDKYGHRLVAAYQALPKRLQVLSQDEFKVLQEADAIYKDKGFEYYTMKHTLPGLSKLPDLAALDLLAVKLVEG